MNWRVVIRPEVEQDVVEAAIWYESRQPGLGVEFVEEIIRVWDALAENPLLNSRRHPHKNIRWRYPDRFPYRVIYEVVEAGHGDCGGSLARGTSRPSLAKPCVNGNPPTSDSRLHKVSTRQEILKAKARLTRQAA